MYSSLKNSLTKLIVHVYDYVILSYGTEKGSVYLEFTASDAAMFRFVTIIS